MGLGGEAGQERCGNTRAAASHLLQVQCNLAHGCYQEAGESQKGRSWAVRIGQKEGSEGCMKSSICRGFWFWV